MKFNVKDLTPRIGSEIEIDVESLINGSKAKEIREILEYRGVVVFRNLDMDDDQQVTVAKTLGELVEG